VGLYPYLNMVPFRFPSPVPDITFVYDSPAGISERARRGDLHVAIVSVTDVFALEDAWEPLGPYGIATRSRAQSVLLFSDRRWSELGGGTIYVTPESRTSVRLLEIILREKHGIHDFRFTDDPEEAIARLWIGDRAIRRMRDAQHTPYMYDLGEEWTTWQYLPFVFARWIVRKDVPSSCRANFGYRLGRVLESNLKNLKPLVEPYRELMSSEEAVFYLRGFIYRFGPTEDKGLARFRDYLERIEPPVNLVPGVAT